MEEESIAAHGGGLTKKNVSIRLNKNLGAKLKT